MLATIVRTLIRTSAVIMIGQFCTEGAQAQFPCLSGFVLDERGAPVVGADLDFDDVATGVRLVTLGDNTDILGFYKVCVRPGVYHVSFEPPPGTHLMGKRLLNLSLLTGFELDVTLNTGLAVNGTVTDSLGTPVPGVDLDVDVLGGGRVYTPGDKTDILGDYRVVIPAGQYRFRYDPPLKSHWLGLQLDTVTITGDTTVDISLISGTALSGAITDNLGGALTSVAVVLKETTTGVKPFVSKNKSDSLGEYWVVAKPNMYTVQYSPPQGSRFIGQEIDSVVLGADTVIDISLQEGVLITTFVRDENGIPVIGADLDYTVESTRVRLFTPNDKTDPSGVATVAIAPGIYEIKVDPPLGSVLDKVVLRNVTISNDTTIDFILPPLNRVSITGRVVDHSGVGVRDVSLSAIELSTGATRTVKNRLTDSLGFFNAGVPLGNIDLMFSPRRGSRHVGARFNAVSLAQDSIWGVVTLDSGIVVEAFVVDRKLNPAHQSSLNWLDISTGVEVYTSHDSVDASGLTLTTVPPGDYMLQVRNTSGVVSLTVEALTLSADTSFTLLLGSGGGVLPERFSLKQNYPNPFNGSTRLPYLLLTDSEVSIDVFNSLGQRVKGFSPVQQQAGYYEPLWDGYNDNGYPAASGVYIYRLHTSAGVESRSLILLR